MNEHLKLILVLIFLTYSFSFAFSQSYIEPKILYAPRNYGARKHLQRISKPKENFLKDTQDLLQNLGTLAGVRELRETAETWPKVNKLHQLILNTASNLRSKSQKNQDLIQNLGTLTGVRELPATADTMPEKMDKLHKSILYSNTKSASASRSKPQDGSERCDKKCFKPSCHVKCSGRESLAACKANSCESVTRGADSASLCAGPHCIAKCIKKNCMATCDGSGCTGTCKGESCITVATGQQAVSKCSKPHCMASVRGIQTVSKCEGNACKANCAGDKCIARCTGAKCTAACQGKDCVAQCAGIGCKDLQEIAPQKVAVQSNNLREGKDQFQEMNLRGRNVSDLRNGVRNQDDDTVTFEYTVALELNKKLQEFIKKHAALYNNIKNWYSLLG